MNVDTLWKALTANNISDNAMVNLLETYSSLLNDILTDKYTLLTNAIVRGHHKLALALINCSAVDKDKYGYGNTPLTTAYKCNAPDIAIALINANVNIKLASNAHPDDISDIDKRKEIHALIESKLKSQPEPKKEMVISSMRLVNLVSSFEADIGLLTLVIKAHKDVLNVSLNGFSNILFWAVCKKKTFICKVLIEQGVNINYYTANYDTALLLAVQQESWDCAEQLILAGAKTDFKSQSGLTALEYIEKIKSSDTRSEKIRQLLESKMIKPDEKTIEIKPIEPSVETPVQTPVPKLSVAFKLIQFMRENNLDYSFSNNQITTAPNNKLVDFVISNNIAFAESATKLTIIL